MVRQHNVEICHYFPDVQTLGDRPPPPNSRTPLVVGGPRERKLETLRAHLEEVDQNFYDEGFDDTERFGQKAIFDAWWKGFLEGWMIAVNALNLPSSSPFQDPSQVPLLKDPVEAHVEEAPVMEEEDRPSMRELAKQIEAHTEVIDLDNLILPNAPEGSEATGPLPNLFPPVP
ncbi:hypothetical protein SO802_026036 [Lithocarpus litseifolius]|uniref:Uncharacterized protein n=1 Tax=Lithocarpus litseifolius TaxID=425828 RepID=A0AAW2BYG6_9ROSI